MQQREIIAVIDAKRIKGIADFQDIESLANRFPYCSTFQTLKAIGLKEQDSIEFKTQLNRASIAIQDRSKLYEYIVKDNLLHRIEESEAEEKVQVEASAELEVETTDFIEEEIEILQEEETASAETIIERAEEADIEEKQNSDHFKSEALEDQIMREAISHLGEMESDIRLAELAKEEPLPNIESKKEAKPQEPLSFGAWLLEKDKKEEPNEPVERLIIDKFIQESPQISPVKKAFFSPSQMGKLSLIEDESFVTETLAGIYERQGDFKKAAKAYKNLGLKFPEKRLYFADLQKRAEGQIK